MSGGPIAATVEQLRSISLDCPTDFDAITLCMSDLIGGQIRSWREVFHVPQGCSEKP